MLNFLKSVMKPAVYHGRNKKPPFFEGWYYKLVSADETERIAVIPAVFLGEEGHAFIQVVDGVRGRMEYHPFPLADFSAAQDDFEIHIGSNSFDLNGFNLNLDDGAVRAAGSVRLEALKPWPVRVLSPGVMGWYAWMPAMECYHGVLSFDHALSGSLTLDGREINLDGGRGYLEKDWGASFPEGYVWMQTNHFGMADVSLMASVAVIPWLNSAFPGFIIGLWHQGQLHRFATYTGAVLERLEIQADLFHISVRDRHLQLQLTTTRPEGIPLKGPTKVDMGMRVDESLAAEVHVRLSAKDGKVMFEGTGLHAGLEIVHPERLLQEIGRKLK